MLALLACAALWLLGACTDVDHCPKGTLRCLGGPCDNRQCDFDLVCGGLTSGEELCGKQLAGNTYDFGRGKPEEATPVEPVNPDCSCKAPLACSNDTGECVNYCEAANPLPRSSAPPEAIFCEHEIGQPALTFEEICKRQCRLSCQRWSQFCGFTCTEGYCDTPQVQDECAATCPAAQGNREVCLTLACNAARDQTCASVICPGPGNPPGSCENLTCRNTCGPGGSGEYAGDGVCDDGDLYAARSGVCDWGSDCVDCGPRMGPVPTPQPQGSLCAFHSNCLGYSPSILANRAWCLLLSEVQPGLSRCVPDCSQGKSCPSGYECRAVMDDEGMAITDPTGEITGQACMPTVCGG